MIRTARALLLCAPPALLIAACRPAAERAANRAEVHAVLVSEEPRHHLVYSNEIVHVMDIVVGPGDTTLWHIHAHPLVVVRLRNARTWDQTLGSEPGAIDTAASVPAVTDNWSRAQPYTHRVGNVDTVGFHYLASEWLKSSGVTCDSMPDTPIRKLVKSGPTAFIYRMTIAPRSAVEMHSHACPGLLVQGSSGAIVNDATAPLAAGGSGEGQWSWHAASYTHAMRNDGSTAVILYEIDWR